MNLTRIFAESLLRRFTEWCPGQPRSKAGHMAISISSAAAYMLCLQTNRSMATYLKNGHWQEIGRLAYLPIDIEAINLPSPGLPRIRGTTDFGHFFHVYMTNYKMLGMSNFDTQMAEECTIREKS